jgi:hypothetical protein
VDDVYTRIGWFLIYALSYPSVAYFFLLQIYAATKLFCSEAIGDATT